MTFTIIGIDKKNKELGIACFSKAFAVGAIAPAADLRFGAVSTQSYPNVSYKEKGIELMKKYSPEKAISILVNSDKDKEIRQVILMNKNGQSAEFTGKKNVPWAGGIKGKDCICAGNILIGERVLIEMVKAFEKSKKSLAEKLIEALKAGEKRGGDKRKRKYNSASLIVEKNRGGIFGIGNRYLDLRADCSKDSIKELSNLLKTKLNLIKKYSKK